MGLYCRGGWSGVFVCECIIDEDGVGRGGEGGREGGNVYLIIVLICK